MCYRCTEPKFANEIVSGLGSQLYGARWTPKGSFATVYLCETAEAALQEYLARGRRMKIPDHKALPMVMAAVTVKVGNLLDGTNAEVEKAVRIYLEGEKGHWRTVQGTREAVSQAIGRAVYELKFSGLMVMSQALKGGRNVVLFPRNLQKGEVLSAPELSIGE
ncbi:MAG TPA: RES family NAD+ phosphorylase [Verrucomicrobiae bacterium]